MKAIRLITPLIVVLLILSVGAYAQQAKPTPPAEAYKACEGKSAGDAAQFVGKSGKTIKGTCTDLDGKLVALPDRAKAKAAKMKYAIPEAAYKACEGKNAGDVAEYVGKRGKTIKGTCKDMEGKLVVLPDRHARKGEGMKRTIPETAYNACEGKKAGDTAQLVTKGGKTLTGTCKELDGKLVLQPDRPQKKAE